MTAISHLKLGLAAIGVILWAYGVRTDDHTLSWIGIAFLVAAFLLRFWRRRGSEPPEGGGDES